MPTLRRDDGVQFVVQSYRELLSAKKISVLKREIRALAKSHGEFVRCYSQENGQMEVVFSREPGFLLGETVWDHFGRPQDLIYCEALPDRQYALLVIVRDGSIYLDTKAVYTDLLDEFLALAVNNERYCIYVYGNVPLSDVPDEGVFVFDSSRVQEFKRLAEPLFVNLTLNTEFQLQPLELALTTSKFSRPIFLPLLIICTAIFVSIGLWNWYAANTEYQVAVQKINVEPYVDYNSALMTPAPQSQIQELINAIAKTYTLPGWQLATIDYKKGQYVAKLTSSAGDKSLLQFWAKRNQLNVKLDTDKNDTATLALSSHLQNRAQPKYIYNLQKTIVLFNTRLERILTKENIHVTNATNRGEVQFVNITIDFHEFSPNVLLALGKICNDFPVSINSITIDAKDNLLSGNVVLSMWGN